MPLRLPPLSSLRFFEAAGRHQSFKLAAAELNVTPSAVSHGIVSLEQTLGVELFIRAPRRLTLTPAGTDYLRYISEAFALIATGTQRLPDRHGRSISVSCAPTLASRWLLPRLQDFRTLWPDTNVSVDTSARQVNLPTDGFDFAIRMSRTPAADPAWRKLFGEQLVPVCSPACRDSLRGRDGKVDLRRATLIHVTQASEDWQTWLARTGTDGIDARRGLHVDTIQLAFEAAIGGLGVALGRRPLVDRDLASGMLVELGKELRTDLVDAETAYWLVSAETAGERADVAGFRSWLLTEAQESVHANSSR